MVGPPTDSGGEFSASGTVIPHQASHSDMDVTRDVLRRAAAKQKASVVITEARSLEEAEMILKEEPSMFDAVIGLVARGTDDVDMARLAHGYADVVSRQCCSRPVTR